MRIFKQLLIVFIICLCGQGISALLPIIVPANIVSMALLLLLLLFHVIKEDHIKDTSEFLLANLSFFFVPLTVGIIENIDLIKDSIFAILIICIVTTFLTFATTAFTVVGVIRLMDKKRGKKYE